MALEPGGIGVKSSEMSKISALQDLFGTAKMNVNGMEHGNSGVKTLVVIPLKNVRQKLLASRMEPKRCGKSGRYLRVLNCAPENGLSLLVCGRECVLVIPRSASKNATGLEVIELPRSA